MRKNIITLALENINNKIAFTEDNLELNLSYAARRDLEKEHVMLTGIKQGIDDLINATFTSPSDFQWELDDGSAKTSAYTALSAVNTAYSAVFYAWRRERMTTDTMVNGRALSPVEIAVKQQEEAIFGFDAENDEFEKPISLEEALINASAVYSYALHISRFEGLKWMTGFDVTGEGGERSTVNLLLPFSFWCARRAVEVSPNEGLGRMYRDCGKEIGDLHMKIDDAKPVFRNWLYEPCDDGTYSDRNTRIVTRVADAQVGKMFDSLKSRTPGDMKTSLNKMSLWELITCSPMAKRVVEEYRASDDYNDALDEERLNQLEAKAEQLAVAMARAKRREAMDKREAEINKRIEELLNPPKPKPAKAAEPAPKPEPVKAAKPANGAAAQKLSELQAKYGKDTKVSIIASVN
jgi:hypothetical protein